jgi:hypothetical protein
MQSLLPSVIFSFQSTDLVSDLTDLSGGRIGVVPIREYGRLGASVPCIISGSDVHDFKVDPFNADRVYTACDDGKVRIWELKDEMKVDVETPASCFSCHSCRVSLLLVHHLVKDVLFTVELLKLLYILGFC